MGQRQSSSHPQSESRLAATRLIDAESPILSFQRGRLDQLPLEEWMACCALLQQGSGSVTRLDLGSNEVAAQNPSKASVIHQGLSHALTGMSTLEELILSRFSCASEHRSCWIQTLEALQTPLTQSLLVLSVRACNLDDECAMVLAHSLCQARRLPLTTLSVADNAIGDRGMRALLGALDRAEMVLEVLSVGGNPFSSASCPALVAAVHASRHTMQDLNTDGSLMDGNAHRELGMELLGCPQLKRWRGLDIQALRSEGHLVLPAMRPLSWEELPTLRVLCGLEDIAGEAAPVVMARLHGLPTLSPDGRHDPILHDFLRDLCAAFGGQGALHMDLGLESRPLKNIIMMESTCWECPATVHLGFCSTPSSFGPLMSLNSYQRVCHMLSLKEDAPSLVQEMLSVLGDWLQLQRQSLQQAYLAEEERSSKEEEVDMPG